MLHGAARKVKISTACAGPCEARQRKPKEGAYMIHGGERVVKVITIKKKKRNERGGKNSSKKFLLLIL